MLATCCQHLSVNFQTSSFYNFFNLSHKDFSSQLQNLLSSSFHLILIEKQFVWKEMVKEVCFYGWYHGDKLLVQVYFILGYVKLRNVDQMSSKWTFCHCNLRSIIKLSFFLQMKAVLIAATVLFHCLGQRCILGNAVYLFNHVQAF